MSLIILILIVFTLSVIVKVPLTFVKYIGVSHFSLKLQKPQKNHQKLEKENN